MGNTPCVGLIIDINKLNLKVEDIVRVTVNKGDNYY